MAINLNIQYPGKTAGVSPPWPFGEPRNITVSGDGTGTPWELALLKDIVGFQQALLSRAGVVPSGTPDEVGASQYLDALLSFLNNTNAAGIDDDFINTTDVIDAGFVNNSIIDSLYDSVIGMLETRIASGVGGGMQSSIAFNNNVGRIVSEQWVFIPVLGNATNDAEHRFGISPNSGLYNVGLRRNSVYFSYSNAINGGAFQTHTEDGSTVETKNPVSPVVVAGNTRYKLKIILTPGVDAEFFINDTSVGLHNVTLPVPSRLISPVTSITSTLTDGSTETVHYNDRTIATQEFTSGR